jgi:hypothetical protein
MSAARGAAFAAAVGVALALARAGAAQETNASTAAQQPAGAARETNASAAAQQSAGAARQTIDPTAEDEIVVLGRIGALRHELEVAEDAMYDRFNEIVGDHRLEIHCRPEQKLDSHTSRRVCLPNGYREEDSKFAQAAVDQMRGEIGPNQQQYRAQQIRVQQQVAKEMRRLGAKDPQLRDAIVRVGKAQDALAEQTSAQAVHSVSRELEPGDQGRPPDAKHAYEVRAGREPWDLALTARTFTFAAVTGEIRQLRVKCDQGDRRIDYKPDVDWTLPSAWGACSLQVDATPGTTFALYEFD